MCIVMVNMFKKNKIKRAVEIIDKLRESRVFDKGKESTKLIREWREKRR